MSEAATQLITAVEPETPAEYITQARSIADMCREIVNAAVATIQGKRYPQVEAWQAIAIAHGCALSAKDIEKTDSGYRATGEVRRIEDGILIASAEGFVGNDENRWRSKPEHAKRAMAQTRAMSRAGRSAFAHVILLIDKNIKTTPAEEMDFTRPPEPDQPPTVIDADTGEARDTLFPEPPPEPSTPQGACVKAFAQLVPAVSREDLESYAGLQRDGWSDGTVARFRDVYKRYIAPGNSKAALALLREEFQGEAQTNASAQ